MTEDPTLSNPRIAPPFLDKDSVPCDLFLLFLDWSQNFVSLLKKKKMAEHLLPEYF